MTLFSYNKGIIKQGIVSLNLFMSNLCSFSIWIINILIINTRTEILHLRQTRVSSTKDSPLTLVTLESKNV